MGLLLLLFTSSLRANVFRNDFVLPFIISFFLFWGTFFPPLSAFFLSAGVSRGQTLGRVLDRLWECAIGRLWTDSGQTGSEPWTDRGNKPWTECVSEPWTDCGSEN